MCIRDRGKDMDKFCGKCGAPLGGGKFCPNCGAQVEGAPSPTPDKAERLLVSTQSSRTALKSFQIVFLILYYVIVLILLLMIFTHWSEYMIRTGLIGLDPVSYTHLQRSAGWFPGPADVVRLAAQRRLYRGYAQHHL